MKNKYESVVIDVSLEEGCFDQLMSLKNSPILKNANHVYIMTVYNEKMKACLPSHIVDSTDHGQITEYAKAKMEDLKMELLPSDTNSESWHTEIVFNNDAKRVALDYLKERKAELAITATRGEQGITGFFKDSFAFYLVQHAPCDVYVVRPVH
ncbi:MAG: universal stress protein [Deltaproteobacteria bacterium]|nr:MAG: universal stress protein [Deltaproteobacteria bacterium]